MSTSTTNNQEFQLETVKTEPCKIRYGAIVVRPEDYAFRDDSELRQEGETPLRHLSDDIKAQGGLNTPLLVKRMADGKHLLLDGHRRYFSIGMLISDGVQGFHHDMDLPANVIVSEVNELALVARSISANVQRQPLSPEGRLRAAIRLHRLGMPRKDIAQLFVVSPTQIDRDLTLAADEVMLAHVKAHCITATAAATVMKLAADKGRLDEWKAVFEDWLAAAEREIEAESRQREEADDKPLSESERWPQRRLSGAQVTAWKEALETGEPFGPPRFRFKAAIREAKGVHHLEIAGLSQTIEEMSIEDLYRVTARLVDLAPQLRHELDKKIAARKQQPRQADQGETEPPSRILQRELGLEAIDDSDDEDDADEEESASNAPMPVSTGAPPESNS